MKTQLIAAGANASSVSSLQVASVVAAKVTTTTTSTTTTTEGIYMFSGSISINATSVTVRQMEIAVRATLASHFVVALDEVDVSVHRGWEVGGWQVGGTWRTEHTVWSILYTIRASGWTKATIIEYRTILLNDRDAIATKDFMRQLGVHLITAGVAYQLLDLTFFVGTGDTMTTAPGTGTSTTTKAQIIIGTSPSERCFLSIPVITSILLMLYDR